MDTSDIATTMLSMSALKTQTLANIAVLKKQFDMEKAAIDMLDPPQSPAPAPHGTGRLVDKTA